MSAQQTKADEIARVLEDAILSGELTAGAILRQEQLSEEFGVSRTPVRAALNRLAALGLVSFAGKRGVKVRPLAQDELLETFVVRAALEGFAAQMAVERLTKAELRRLEQAEIRFARLTKSLRAAAAAGDDARSVASDWVLANDDFHDVYINASGVQKLADAARTARRVFHGQAAWSASNELNELYESNLEQHREIVDAFRGRDPRVRDVVETHILDSGRLLERALDDAGYGSASIGRRVSWAASSR
jgi:DNA-binding GntR family transcriptional regulator